MDNILAWPVCGETGGGGTPLGRSSQDVVNLQTVQCDTTVESSPHLPSVVGVWRVDRPGRQPGKPNLHTNREFSL